MFFAVSFVIANVVGIAIEPAIRVIVRKIARWERVRFGRRVCIATAIPCLGLEIA